MGVLPSQTILEMMCVGFVCNVDPSFINPASLDIPLSGEAYRLAHTLMPKLGERVQDMLKSAGATLHPLDVPLEVGVSYLVRAEIKLALPSGVYAYANPKSSTGRINVLSRMIVDGVGLYDTWPAGTNGDVWFLVQPRSFPIILSPGIALSQLRFFTGKSFLDQLGLEMAHQEHGLFFDAHGKKLRVPEKGIREHADSLFMSIRAKKGEVGWRCLGSSTVLDLRKRNYCPEDFGFEPVKARDQAIEILPRAFYILTTDEHLKVPPLNSAELRATDPRLGEFRVHAAGFIDPGWGCGGTGVGRPITLEVVTSEATPVVLRHGQPVGRIRYEVMAGAPDCLYDDTATSNYTGQTAAQLGKYFKV